MDIGLERVQLNDLRPELNNALIAGIIIAKQQPRRFTENKNGEATRERAVWNFTIRDSPVAYINVTCWGSPEYIFGLNENFHVGNIVDIHQPQIEIRKINDYGEQFRPRVTSPYSLVVNESSGVKIFIHEGNVLAYKALLHLPTKPIAGAVTLADIHNAKEKIEGVDILGAVRTVGKSRKITTKNGAEQQVRDIVLFDRTNPALKISIWDLDLIIEAGTWKICDTILFLTDVRCQWSVFARSMVAIITSRTVVTKDPLSVEAENLRKYAKEAPLQSSAIIDQLAFSVPDPSSIQNVMNVQQVLDKANMIASSSNISIEQQQFTALLYVVVTQLDLDGLSRKVSKKCSLCETLILSPAIICTNIDCPISSGLQNAEPIVSFDLRVLLCDQTGSLVNCRLSGHTAEAILNCTVQEFLSLSDEEKSILKWNLLMERCATRILVVCTGFRPVISILSCQKADSYEVANRLPHY